MPLISDPGSGLVAAAAAAGHPVIPIAGPSAFLLALVASGLLSSKFTFVGFLPDKAKRRQEELQDLAGASHSGMCACGHCSECLGCLIAVNLLYVEVVL